MRSTVHTPAFMQSIWYAILMSVVFLLISADGVVIVVGSDGAVAVVVVLVGVSVPLKLLLLFGLTVLLLMLLLSHLLTAKI